MPDLPPPPTQESDQNNYSWRHWYKLLHDYITSVGALSWSVLNFTGSDLTDIQTRKHNDLQNIQGGSTTERYHLTQGQLTSLTSLPTLAHGVYTPTLTDETNITSSVAFQCQYLRVGSVVTVSGKVSALATDPDITTVLGMTIPIASNFGAEEDLGGSSHTNENDRFGAAFRADAGNDRASLVWKSESSVSNRVMHFSFTYRII
jgi:hypothetical protein